MTNNYIIFSTICLIIINFTFILYYIFNNNKKNKIIKKLITKIEHEKLLRIATEKKITEVVQKKLNINENSGSFVFHQIAIIESCFKHVIGTPRQGFLSPSTKGKIKFSLQISPEAFDGLDGYSHIWIFFIFHLNTNIGKSLLSASENNTNDNNQWKKGGKFLHHI